MAWHEPYVRLPLLRRFVCCSKKKFHEWHWQRNSHCTMMIFFFCSSSSSAALDFFRCIVQSVWGSNDMRVRAGSVFLLHKPTATETTKQRNVQKNFRISRLFSFSLSMFLNVWVCVCVVTVVWHCGITVWNVTTIYKGMTFVKWLGKTLLK